MSGNNKLNPRANAFPHHTMADGELSPAYGGLTKREYFAAMAMQGLLAVPTTLADVDTFKVRAARVSVACADALIEELNKGAI